MIQVARTQGEIRLLMSLADDVGVRAARLLADGLSDELSEAIEHAIALLAIPAEIRRSATRS